VDLAGQVFLLAAVAVAHRVQQVVALAVLVFMLAELEQHTPVIQLVVVVVVGLLALVLTVLLACLVLVVLVDLAAVAAADI
jgi:hypothetical protein